MSKFHSPQSPVISKVQKIFSLQAELPRRGGAIAVFDSTASVRETTIVGNIPSGSRRTDRDYGRATDATTLDGKSWIEVLGPRPRNDGPFSMTLPAHAHCLANPRREMLQRIAGISR